MVWNPAALLTHYPLFASRITVGIDCYLIGSYKQKLRNVAIFNNCLKLLNSHPIGMLQTHFFRLSGLDTGLKPVCTLASHFIPVLFL